MVINNNTNDMDVTYTREHAHIPDTTIAYGWALIEHVL